MRYGRFGTSGLRVSEMFLGTMTFGERGGGAPIEECRRMLDAYADAGGNVIDTAVNYARGESEEIVGELLIGRRDQFVLATKYTNSRDLDDPNGAGSHRKNLRLSLETSLRRLRTDHIDVYWVHLWDRSTAIEETMRALDDQVRAGKVLYVGVSNMPAWLVSRANTLAELRDWSPFVGLQVQYSLLQRDVERELLPMAEAYGMTVAAWGPLAGGILSGKFNRPQPPGATKTPTRVDPSAISEQQRSVAATVEAVARGLGVSPSQVALAWTQSGSPLIRPILGARRLDQLVDNLGAAEVVLPADAVARLDACCALEVGYPMGFIDKIEHMVFGAAALAH
jgi:aryl-alcohol dehydrogenase-like predicted oxidoreductase